MPKPTAPPKPAAPMRGDIWMNSHHARPALKRSATLFAIAAALYAQAISIGLPPPLVLAAGAWRSVWLGFATLTVLFVAHDEMCRAGHPAIEGPFKAALLASALPFDKTTNMLVAMITAVGQEALFRAMVFTYLPHFVLGTAVSACVVGAYEALHWCRAERALFERFIPLVAALDAVGFCVAFWFGGLACSLFAHTMHVVAMNALCRDGEARTAEEASAAQKASKGKGGKKGR